MSLLTPADIRARAGRIWDSQQFLRSWLAGEVLFPVDFPVKVPSGPELVTRFAEVNAWLQGLRAESKKAGYRLLEREVAHRQLGMQRLPVRVMIESEEDFLVLTNKRQAFARFKRLTEETRRRVPELEDFLRQKPLAALELAEAWGRLLTVCEFFRRSPRPGRYLRELDIEGVDTKFIEQHKAILRELLALALPVAAVEPSVRGLAQHGFERWLGLRYDPPLIRFRWLDPACAPAGLTDLSLPLGDFAAYAPQVRRVFITENKVNGLSFPAQPGSMVIFGLGYGVQALAEVPWLKDRPIYYWGDIDTHGFAILSQLRSYFPQTRSMLMDRETLLAHRAFWGQEPEDRRSKGDPGGLSEAERELLQALQSDVIGERVRLEQERVPFSWLLRELAALEDRNIDSQPR